nr:hypothetical protein [Tanacetum cinerariifolium]
MAIGLGIEGGIAGLRELDLLGPALRQYRRRFGLAEKGAAVALGAADGVGDEIEHALELAAHPHRPAHRRHVEREHVGDF